MAVASREISLRPAGTDDAVFLRRVYASTREAELAVLPWTDAEKATFVNQQFDAQAIHYRQNYVGASFNVIERDSRPVGRLYVARWDDEIRIMDIALLPAHRGTGIGTHLLRELLDEGARTGRRVSIHVEKHNPAVRLYERLGFAPVADRGVYLLLEASP